MKSASRLLLAALVLGIVVRLALVLASPAAVKTQALESIADAPEYVRLADNLARRSVFSLDSAPPFRPDIFRTPVYPLFLAGFFRLFTPPLLPALLGQLLLSLGIIWATYRLARELELDPTSAAVAAMLTALSPNLAFLSTKLVTETLFTLELVVALLLLNRFRTARRARDLVAAGVLSGLLILTRPVATFFPLLMAIYVLWLGLRSGYWRSAIGHSLLPLAAATVVVMPWVIRNGRTTGRYIISTVSEHNIYLYSGASTLAADKGICLAAARDSMMAQALAEFGPLDSTDEASFWAALSTVGRRQVQRNPVLALKVHLLGSAAACAMPIGIRPLLIHYGAGTNADFATTPHLAQQAIGLAARGRVGAAVKLVWQERMARMPVPALVVLGLAVLFHLGLMLFFLIGLFVRAGRNLLWLLLPILYFAAIVGPVGEARFRAPVEPLIAILAAAGLVSMRRGRSPGSE